MNMKQNYMVFHRLSRSIFFSLLLLLTCISRGAAEPKLPLERTGYFYLNNHYITRDIHDKKVSIPDYLSEGKAVLVELCGIWSVNGQEIHKQGMLKNLYATYGPEGTKELEVIWVNTDSTTLEEIQGFSYWGNGFDWTDGGTIPYPILNTSKFSPTYGFLWTYLPKFYLIEPSGWCLDVTKMLLSEDMKLVENYSAIIRELLDKQVGTKSAPIVESIGGVETLFVGETGYFESRTRYWGNLTSIQWSAEGTTETSDANTFRPVWSQPGTYKVRVKVSNEYGDATKEISVTVLGDEEKVSTFPTKFGFDDSKVPTTWRVYDQDEDGYCWLPLAKDQKDRISAEMLATLGGLGGTADALVSYSYYMTHFDFEYEEGFGFYLKPEDWLITPTIVIPEDATKATLNYLDGYFYSVEKKERVDGYKVLLSESGIAPEDFKVTLFNKPTIESSEDKTPAFERTIDLTPYAGKSIRIAFVHPARYSYEVGTGVIIDEVTVTSDGHNPSPRYTTDQPYIELSTSRKSGSWSFNIDAPEEAQQNCWADLNGNGMYDLGEEEGFDFRFTNYRKEIGSQKLRIYGDLTRFECSFQEITEIDLSHAPHLTTFVSNYNKGLTQLDLSHNEELIKLEAYGNGLTNLTLGRKPQLKTLDLNSNALTSLDLHEAPLLERVDCFGNHIGAKEAHLLVTSLVNKTAEKPGKLYFVNSTFGKEENQILVSDVLLAQSKNWSVIDFNASKPYKGIDNTCYTTELPAITLKAQEATGEWHLQIKVAEGEARDSVWLDLNDNKLFDFGEELTEDILQNGWTAPRGTTSVTLYGAVTQIKCQENKLTEIDCSANDRLELLDCSKNLLSKITLGTQPALKDLYCYQNQLQEIDLSQSPNITSLSLNNNKFTTLDLSNNTKLKVLMLSDNEVSALDLSKLTELVFFACNDNKFTSLDLSKQIKLETLYCVGNKLTALDLSALQELLTLSCESNELTALDLSANKKLEALYCYENAISASSMKKLFTSLSDRSGKTQGKLYAINSSKASERNGYNLEDIAIATAKNWQVNDYKDGANGGTNPLALEIVTTPEQIIPQISQGWLTLSSIEPQTLGKLYTADGLLIREGKTGYDGVLRLDVSALDAGNYILATGQVTLKVVL